MPGSLRVGVVGVGAQGGRHVGKFARLAGCELAGVYDLRREAAEAAAGEHGGRVFAELDELAAAVDAAVVAVPTRDHRQVGLRLLDRGVHVLLEKPIATDARQAADLVAAAREAGRVLAVGHSEFFNPAVRALLERAPTPGFLEVHRLAAFQERSLDVDVILDLMIHDLQVLHALDGSEVAELRASGIHVLTEKIDIASVRIELASGCVANLTASRVSQEPVRKLRLFSRDGAYYSLDYAARRVSGRRLERGDGRPRLVADEMAIDQRDALEAELGAFLAACRGEPAVYVDGEQGRRALETALGVIDAMGAQGRRR